MTAIELKTQTDGSALISAESYQRDARTERLDSQQRDERARAERRTKISRQSAVAPWNVSSVRHPLGAVISQLHRSCTAGRIVAGGTTTMSPEESVATTVWPATQMKVEEAASGST